MGILGRLFGDKGADGDQPSPAPESDAPDFQTLVRSYHQVTKHQAGRFARGPHGLDWETQPDPFRRYAGAELLRLPLSDPPNRLRFDEIVHERAGASVPVDRDSIAALLRYALGLSAWKEYGEARWALRMNPSSGNLHPTEGHLLAGPGIGLGQGALVAHYAPREHALEVRARIDDELWRRLSAALPEGTLLLGLSSILWREAWKYGERAYRYCQHDVGHAIASVTYAASCLGWSVRMVDHLATEEIADLLGLYGFGEAEPEEADCLLAISPGPPAGAAPRLAPDAIAAIAGLERTGQANVLSSGHEEWEAIDACSVAAHKPATEPVTPGTTAATGPAATPPRPRIAYELIAQRRSAVAMDGRTPMPPADFFALLERCMPRPGRVPFAAFPWAPRAHLLLFVHRVEGLERGAYALLREPESGARLRAACSEEFDWAPVTGAPEGLPLHHLRDGDLRFMAASVSCEQSIAGDGAFSLGMIVDFEAALEEHGPWYYPRLFWETGLVGQALYLEAEAAALRGTGIGCFFDDAVHRLLGLRTSEFQSLYHFTIGGPVEDARIQTGPAYPAEAR